MSRSNNRFPTRRQWHNTMVVVWFAPVCVILGIMIFAVTGSLYPLGLFFAGLFLSVVIAMVRDIGNKSVYIVENGLLVLSNGAQKLEIPLGDISDVSLIDRSGARAYIQGRLAQKDMTERSSIRERYREFTKFSTIDIGLTSYTFGLGRYFIDRLPHGSRDVLLVRLRDGSSLVLSPAYNQEMVSALTRQTSTF